MKKDLKLYNEPGSSLKNKTGSWRNFKPVVDKSKCIACGQCSDFCPEGCIHKQEINKSINQKNKFYYEADLDYCKGCGLCAQVCPVKCIKMEIEK